MKTIQIYKFEELSEKSKNYAFAEKIEHCLWYFWYHYYDLGEAQDIYSKSDSIEYVWDKFYEYLMIKQTFYNRRATDDDNMVFIDMINEDAKNDFVKILNMFDYFESGKIYFK